MHPEISLKSGSPFPTPKVECPEAKTHGTYGTMPDLRHITASPPSLWSIAPPIKEPPWKRLVVIPVHPDEQAALPRGAGDVWKSLDAWAGYYMVDVDQALLVCAGAAAQAAGPQLEFKSSNYESYPVPTLIAASEDSAFLRTVLGAIDPLRLIQQDLTERYGTATESKAEQSWEESYFERRRENIRQYDIYNGTPSWRLDAKLQPEGVVRLLLEGKPPAKPHRLLEEYHLYVALALMEIEQLPQTVRARERRLEAIVEMVSGYRRGKVWIRGFIRFLRKDLEWVLGSTRHLRTSSLPVGVAEKPQSEDSQVEEPGRDASGKREFDRIHGVALREVLRMRFDRVEPVADFCDEEAASHFGLLRETYRKEMGAVNHLTPICEILPDLFAWYLRHLVKSRHVHADEMEIGARAIEAARTIRRKVVAIYDWNDAQVIGRKRQAQALKLVKRMERLGGSCKRRDLARGLNKQRKKLIAPFIELLIEHGIFSSKGSELSMRTPNSFGDVGLEAFMPPLEEVPYSGTRMLRISEQRQADLAVSQSSAQEPKQS